MVSTRDSESRDPGSNPGGTSFFFFFLTRDLIFWKFLRSKDTFLFILSGMNQNVEENCCLEEENIKEEEEGWRKRKTCA